MNMRHFGILSSAVAALGLLLLSSASTCNRSAQNCVEKIDPACICTKQYDPVCGCNQKTYGNACAAECAGIKTYTKGECPTASPEGKVWRLSTLASGPEPRAVPADLNIFIQLEGGRMSGSGGCNRIGGAYQLDGPQLRFSSIIGTEMYCDKTMQWETDFLKMLESAQSHRIQGATLEINCGDMGSLMFRQEGPKGD
jgi:heat shock protein HslJ